MNHDHPDHLPEEEDLTAMQRDYRNEADRRRLENALFTPRGALVYFGIGILIALLLGGCGESVSERSANEKQEHRMRSLEERVTALEKR